MCGIAGYINLNAEPASPVIVKRMTDSIAHRGPDGEGQWVEENVAMGHRRLSIIDLSPAGHQPMISADHRYVLSYNGEIYNFREIRTELQAAGYQFRSETDSEVLLNAHSQWGEKCVDHFNGMFAFAIWDRKEKQLFLARDRYGIKPLYYAEKNGVFAFGSECKAILDHPAFDARMDKRALLEYFTFQNLFTDRTLFEQIKLLPAGHILRVSSPERKIRRTEYWDFNFQEPETCKDDREYTEELERLFKQAVSRQLVSDVEVGCYLSGGMDSGSIAAVASQQIENLKTFTCGFDLHSASGMEMGFDERGKSEFLSWKFGTEHYEMVLKAGDMERCLPKFAWHLEEPRVGQSYPNYYVAGLASRFVKVTLSGAGGDELFAGYPWRYYRAVVNDDFEHYIDKYYDYWQRLIPNKQIQEVFAPIWGDVKDVWTRDVFRDVFTHHADQLTRPEDYVNHSLYFEAKTFLHGLLVVEDKLSMAHGLETRVPFLDNDLVDFAMKVPVRLKLGNLDEVVRVDENTVGGKKNQYFQRTKDGKMILRNALKGLLPEEYTGAVKQGFSSPDSSWFKGESLAYVADMLLTNEPEIYRWLDKSASQDLLREHLSGNTNRRLLVWSLLNTEHFIHQFSVN